MFVDNVITKGQYIGIEAVKTLVHITSLLTRLERTQ